MERLMEAAVAAVQMTLTLTVTYCTVTRDVTSSCVLSAEPAQTTPEARG